VVVAGAARADAEVLEQDGAAVDRPRRSRPGCLAGGRRARRAGVATAALARVFPDARVTGLDLSEEMVRTAEQTNPGPEYMVGDAAKLPFEDDTFDLVAQNNVPFYPRELKRVLKPGGHILVASTIGPSTPYYTPHSFLRRKLTEVASGQEGRGDWFIGSSS
jgi:SAM-dependent methyltransferase